MTSAAPGKLGPKYRAGDASALPRDRVPLEVPRGLPRDEREVWERTIADAGRGWLTAADRDVMEIYAAAVCSWRRLRGGCESVADKELRAAEKEVADRVFRLAKQLGLALPSSHRVEARRQSAAAAVAAPAGNDEVTAMRERMRVG